MVQILDCTLRDGSYAINFGFTPEDTTRISWRLAELGFPYIEVGHGVGLGASRAGKGVAAATDIEYMMAARGYWGMFCIPGIATLDDVRTMVGFGGKFIRIGCDIADAKKAKPFIELASSFNISVFSNLMKSYASPVSEFVDAAKCCCDSGAQCIYIVDSAGGMLPSEIEEYGLGVKSAVPHDVSIGFHGHNNLGLGVSNALACVDLGFDVIDTTLQGIGRGGGNVPVEQFLPALKRHAPYYKFPGDLIGIMQLGEECIRPLLGRAGISSLDATAGFALFHSSYMPLILSNARKYHVDPRVLIIAVAERDMVNCSQQLVEECAQTISEKCPVRFPVSAYYGEEQS